MPYIAPEVITEAKRMDLLTYLREYEPGELVKFSSNTYTTRTHDSLKISNGKWMWWSRGIGGKSALDYLIKVRGMDFVEAVQTIMGNGSVSFPTCENIKSYENQPLLLPEKSPTILPFVRQTDGRSGNQPCFEKADTGQRLTRCGISQLPSRKYNLQAEMERRRYEIGSRRLRTRPNGYGCRCLQPYNRRGQAI